MMMKTIMNSLFRSNYKLFIHKEFILKQIRLLSTGPHINILEPIPVDEITSKNIAVSYVF